MKSNLLPILLCALQAVLLPKYAVAASSYEEVIEITTKSDFDTKIVNRKDGSIWMVQFYDPSSDSCEKLAPIYGATAFMLKGFYHLATVDATTDYGAEIAKQYDVSKYPTIKIFQPDKKKPIDYKGKHEVEGIIQGIMAEFQNLLQYRSQHLPDELKRQMAGVGKQQKQEGGSEEPSKVITLTDDNFDEIVMKSNDVWLIGFFAPWCGHCKAILPDWEEAARNLDGEGVSLGSVDATTQEKTAGQYGVKGFPTIKIFPGGAPKTPDMVINYEQGRTKSDFIKYALAEVDRTGVPKEIPQLTSMDVFDETCKGKNRICVMAGLPHILDSSAEKRNKFKETLSTAAKEFRGTPLVFTWFEGSSQPALEEALGLTFGFPAVAVLASDRLAYSRMTNSFSEKNVVSFLHRIIMGRQGTSLIAELPKIATVEAWDGLDGTPIEEESLADIMGWDDDDENVGGEL